MGFFNVTPNPIYGIHNPVGLKYLTHLRVGLSHLRAHKHQYNFSDISSKYCSCRDNLPETVEHYLLHCPIYSLLRRELFGKLRLIVSPLTITSSAYTCNLLLYGNPCHDFHGDRTTPPPPLDNCPPDNFPTPIAPLDNPHPLDNSHLG